MSNNLRESALKLAVEATGLWKDQPVAIIDVAEEFYRFLVQGDQTYTYFRFEGMGIYYRTRNSEGQDAKAQRGTGTYGGRWETSYSRSNPQTLKELKANPEYHQISEEELPGHLRSRS